MMNNVEHLFTCLLGICMSPLEKSLFMSFTHLSIRFLVYLVLNCIMSLYILEINPLSYVSLPNMFSHTVGSLFILLMVWGGGLAVKKLSAKGEVPYFQKVL